MAKTKKFDRKFNKEKSVVLGWSQGLTTEQALDAIELEEQMERRLENCHDVHPTDAPAHFP